MGNTHLFYLAFNSIETVLFGWVIDDRGAREKKESVGEQERLEVTQNLIPCGAAKGDRFMRLLLLRQTRQFAYGTGDRS